MRVQVSGGPKCDVKIDCGRTSRKISQRSGVESEIHEYTVLPEEGGCP
jgi:hypothetical protein